MNEEMKALLEDVKGKMLQHVEDAVKELAIAIPKATELAAKQTSMPWDDIAVAALKGELEKFLLGLADQIKK